MTTVPYDPTLGESFWEDIRKIPGFPSNDHIPLQAMLVERNALHKLPQVVIETRVSPDISLLVVMDSTPMRRGQDDLKSLILGLLRQAGFLFEVITLQPDETGQVHTTMSNIQMVKSQLEAGKSVISIGSGVVTDVAKHACYLFEQETGRHLPYIVYQTANSVNAFTSNMAPVFVDGVKRTLPSRYPEALICDLETLCDAPRPMTLAGVGDQLAPLVSFGDWRIANLLGMDDSYCQLPLALMSSVDETFLDYASDIRMLNHKGMEVLAKVITLGGLVMSLSHATTPLSGYEHVISHILDLVNETNCKPLALHGSQASLCAIISAQAYQIFLDEFDPKTIDLESCFPSQETMQLAIQHVFSTLDPSGSVASECWADYRLKLERWHKQQNALADFLQDWQRIRIEIQNLVRPPEVFKKILLQVGGPTKFADLDPPIQESDVKFAFLSAPLMRRRLTLGDLFIFFNWDRELLWDRVWKTTN